MEKKDDDDDNDDDGDEKKKKDKKSSKNQVQKLKHDYSVGCDRIRSAVKFLLLTIDDMSNRDGDANGDAVIQITSKND